MVTRTHKQSTLAEITKRDAIWSPRANPAAETNANRAAWDRRELLAEVARLRHDLVTALIDLAAHKRALAAGPAVLRRTYERSRNQKYLDTARQVEAAQAAAMKEK